jgi:hypothetical protein
LEFWFHVPVSNLLNKKQAIAYYFSSLQHLQKKEERGISPAAMKITDCLTESISDCVKTTCPGCHCTNCRKHGFYTRKGFHRHDISAVIVKQIQRYLCLNPECVRITFSVLPPMVLRYCRFFYTDLLAIQQALAIDSDPNHFARHAWHIGRRVIVRAAALLERLNTWTGQLYQEVADGRQPDNLERMVDFLIEKLSRIELIERWYRHRYPLRFSHKHEHHTIQRYSVNRG